MPLHLQISIHALCEEGDFTLKTKINAIVDFYPRPLRGGRRIPCPRTYRVYHFYPRPLRGGRHRLLRAGQHLHQISIHALCEEGDKKELAGQFEKANFYPRPLRGGRLRSAFALSLDALFLSTPSARRATCIFLQK